MRFVELAQDAPPTWEVDPNTGEQFVSKPEVCGESWWAILHSIAVAIRDSGCPSCGETAVAGMSALHDLVNVELGKPVHDPENFRVMVQRYAEAWQKSLHDLVDAELERTAHGKKGTAESEAFLLEVVDAFADDPEAPMAQGLGERIGESFVSGIGFGLAGHATTSVLDRLRNAPARSSETATVGLCQEGPKLSAEALKLDTSGHGDFVREQVANPDGFDPDSFRTVPSGAHRVLAACPRGKWIGERCEDGLEVVDLLHPRSEAPQLVAEADARGLPIEDAEMAQTSELLTHGVAGTETVLSGEHEGLAGMRRELPDVRELVLVH